MKMQRYTASDMRTALRRVRAEHGPDVVILSTRRSAGVVELTVASDPEALAHADSLTQGRRIAVGEPMPAPQFARPRPAATAAVATPAAPAPGPVATADPPSQPSEIGRSVRPSDDAETTATAPAARPSPIEPSLPTAPAGAVDLELRALRRLLETQLAALAWNDLTRRSPVAAELLRQLAEIGLERALAGSIVDAVPPGKELAEARIAALEALRARLRTSGENWGEQGGRLVLVGPAGAGKTSALAALAARWVMTHGPRGAALVSAGDTRFGAYENLARLGRLLGLPTYQVDDAAELPSLLERLGDHRLVLIDTAATAPRSEAAEAQTRALAAVRGLATIVLALPATAQGATLRQAAQRYGRLGASACIVTRLDEATSLGGLLSALIGANLPLACATEGTRLPDDLRPMRAADLVALAVSLAERHGATADEELLARRFGGGVHASA